jgi:hypothetical protein
MSTFTRLYFVNRGSHFADTDSQDIPDGADFVAPETIPLDPAVASVRDGLAQLAFLPQPSVTSQGIQHPQRSAAFSHGTTRPQDDQGVAH